MGEPELGEQLLVRQLLRIEVDLEALGVITDRAVRRVRGGSAGIPDASANDSGETPEPGVRTPESTGPERRCLDARGDGEVDRQKVNCG